MVEYCLGCLLLRWFEVLVVMVAGLVLLVVVESFGLCVMRGGGVCEEWNKIERGTVVVTAYDLGQSGSELIGHDEPTVRGVELYP